MANKVYLQQETDHEFYTVTTADPLWDFGLEGLTNGNGRASTRADLGAFPRSGSYFWQAELKCQATPAVGSTIRYYAAWSHDGVDIDGDVNVSATVDAAMTLEATLRSLHYMGSVVVDTADTSKQVGSGVIFIPSRYVTIVAWNDSGATLSATAGDFHLHLYPIPDEIQV